MKWPIGILAAALACPAIAQDIQVLDGDTFILDGELVRLWGVDALEIDQTCRHPRFDRDDPRGIVAFVSLATSLDYFGECVEVATDENGQSLVRCSTEFGHDIGRDLITQRLARADPEHADAEYMARQEIVDSIEDNGRGPVIYDCAPPWEWRAQNPGT